MNKISIDEQQNILREQIKVHLRTTLSEEKYSKISCVLLMTNNVTGKADIIAVNCGNNLVNVVKGYLQAALDQLNRTQLITALLGKKIEEVKKDDV